MTAEVEGEAIAARQPHSDGERRGERERTLEQQSKVAATAAGADDVTLPLGQRLEGERGRAVSRFDPGRRTVAVAVTVAVGGAVISADVRQPVAVASSVPVMVGAPSACSPMVSVPMSAQHVKVGPDVSTFPASVS